MSKLINYVKDNSFKVIPDFDDVYAQLSKSQNIIRKQLIKISKIKGIDDDLIEAINETLNGEELKVSLHIQTDGIEAWVFNENQFEEFMLPKIKVNKSGIYIYTDVSQVQDSVPYYLHQEFKPLIDVLFNNQIVEAR